MAFHPIHDDPDVKMDRLEEQEARRRKISVEALRAEKAQKQGQPLGAAKPTEVPKDKAT